MLNIIALGCMGSFGIDLDAIHDESGERPAGNLNADTVQASQP